MTTPPHHLLHALFHLNIRLETLTAELRPKLHINASHLLNSARYNRGIRASTLTAILRLEKSTVSRLIGRLMEQGYLVYGHPSIGSDRREKPLHVTDEGEVALQDDLRARNLQVERFVEPLSVKERIEFETLLGSLNDSFGAPEGERAPQESVAKVELRRLTRVMGFLGSNLLDTGLSIERLQALRLLSEASGERPLAELGEHLPYERTALHRLLKGLAQDSFVALQRDARDSRKITVRLRQKGRDAYEEALATAANRLKQAIRAMGSDEAEDLAALISKASAGAKAATATKAGELTLVRVLDERGRSAARALLATTAVRLGRAEHLPSQMFSPDSHTLGWWQRDVLQGVVEARTVGGTMELVNVAFMPRISTEKRCVFLQAVHEELSRIAPVKFRHEDVSPRELAKEQLILRAL